MSGCPAYESCATCASCANLYAIHRDFFDLSCPNATSRCDDVVVMVRRAFPNAPSQIGLLFTHSSVTFRATFHIRSFALSSIDYHLASMALLKRTLDATLGAPVDEDGDFTMDHDFVVDGDVTGEETCVVAHAVTPRHVKDTKLFNHKATTEDVLEHVATILPVLRDQRVEDFIDNVVRPQVQKAPPLRSPAVELTPTTWAKGDPAIDELFDQAVEQEPYMPSPPT